MSERNVGFVAVVAAVLMIVAGAQATNILNEDMVLTIDLATGGATLKNVNPTTYHNVTLYQIKSADATGFLSPGTGVLWDPITGNPLPWSPGGWEAIADSFVTDMDATTAALGKYARTYSVLIRSSKRLAETTLSGYAKFQANGATEWFIGDPVLPNMASLADLSFFWRDASQINSDTYIGRIVITPEPATLALLALGGLAVMRKRRK
ncbi:MAG: PEP-CTERM sorting domain-containing protein [Planctomycetota bacterium]|nr:PEP-CTERM sorting domain-containing protein [Planctomycetota bacterium]